MRKILMFAFLFFAQFSFAQTPYPLVTQGAKYFTDGNEIYYHETKLICCFNK